MKVYIKSMLVTTMLLVVTFTGSFADDVIKLDVDEASIRVIDLDFTIDSIEFNITNVDEAIRKADYAADSIDYSLHKYKVFRDTYKRDEKKYDVYLDMSSSKLTEAYSNLLVKKMSITDSSIIASEYYEVLEDDIAFINAIFMFGNSKPELTDEKLYDDFLRNSEFARSSAEYEKEKLLLNIKNTENLISTQVSNLYKGILDVQFAIDMNRDMLKFKKENVDLMKNNYDLGLISKLSYDQEYISYQKSILEYKNLVYTYINLDLSLKNKLKMSSGDTIILVDDFSDRYAQDYTTIKEYKELAIASNNSYNIMLSDLDMLNARLELYKKYNSNLLADEYTDFVFDISQLSLKIDKEAYNIELNVDYAIGDIALKNFEVKKADSAYKISEIVYENSKQKQEMGLLSEIELSEFALDMKSKEIAVKTANRDLENSKYLFDQLINRGVKY